MHFQSVFSQHARILRAKIFTSKQTALAFGYVTMHEKADVELVISKLDKTQYKGHTITVERVGV